MTEYDQLLSTAFKAVELAHELVRTKAPGLVTAKGDRDMASELDYEVEHTLRDFLATETPHVGFLGEEMGITGDSGVLTWALDPIDGTANLLHGLPLCAISLGLLNGTRAVLGVIDLPMIGERYAAFDGGGAFKNGTRIHVSTAAKLRDAAISMGDYAVGELAEQKNFRRLALTSQLAEKAQRVRMLGSAAIDLAWVAAGRLDGTVMLSNTPWDTTAGAVLVREAGGIMIDETGAEHTSESQTTVATTPTIRDELLGVLAATVTPGV